MTHEKKREKAFQPLLQLTFKKMPRIRQNRRIDFFKIFILLNSNLGCLDM